MTDPRFFEVTYTRPDGTIGAIEVQGWHKAKQTAKRLAQETGRRTILARSPKRPWRLFVVCLDDLTVTETKIRFTKREAIEFWRQWNVHRDGGVCVFWPS